MFCCDTGPTQWLYQCSDLDLVPDLEGGRGQLFMALSVQGAVQGCVCEAASGKNTRNPQGKGLWQGGLLGLGTNVVCRARLGSGPGQASVDREPTGAGRSHCTGFLGAAGTWEMGSSLQVGAHIPWRISLSLEGKPRGMKGVLVLSAD